jgi:hypothetical protein
MTEGRWQMAVKAASCFLLALTLGACVVPGTSVVEVSPQRAIAGPRVVAVMGTRTEVVAALEDALTPYGFTFRHYVSRERATEPLGQLPVPENPNINTKYALQVTSDVFDKCMGGGFALKSLTVSVVDRESNELRFRATAQGRTEKCPPVSGKVFHDIASAMDAAWAK